MNEIIKHITVDLSRNVSPRIIFAKQLDHLGRQILVSLTDNGRDYIVSSDAIASFNVLRPDGECGKFTAVVTEDGKLLLTLTSWMLEISGEIACSIALFFGSGAKISSPKIFIEVCEEIAAENEIGDTESVPFLTTLLTDCIQVLEAEDQRAEAEKKRTQAEEERVEAEEERVEADSYRAESEIRRNEAEKSRDENEKERKASEILRNTREDMRNDAENQRIEAEKARVAAEEARVLADINRENRASQFPIGSVYISFESTAPASIFGGSWVAIDEGRFLMASKKASGNTGGNKNHLHEMWMAAANMNVDSSGNLNYQELYAYDKNETFMRYTYNKSVPINTYASESQGEEFFGVRVIGTTDRSDHTPPYVTVYMWRRVA